MQKHIAIIGNWAYGTALAYLLWKKHRISIFGRIPKNEIEMSIDDFGTIGEHFDYLIISITTKPLSQVLREIASRIPLDTHVILAMKWLTEEGKLPIDACQEVLPSHKISVLSGPGFAEEILSDTPVHLVLASDAFHDEEEQDFLIDNLTMDFTPDVYWVSWCGVLKNIYAIGAGIASKESGFDRSLFTRNAVHEMGALLEFLGFDRETAHGPAGRGDVWICTTPNSRNFRYWAGDISLRDQAEGYSAANVFSDHYRKKIPKEMIPILSSVIEKIH